MDKIWANRLVAGTKTWAEMPASRRPGVKRELAKRVAEGEITPEQYKEITGEDYDGNDTGAAGKAGAGPLGPGGQAGHRRA